MSKFPSSEMSEEFPLGPRKLASVDFPAPYNLAIKVGKICVEDET